MYRKVCVFMGVEKLKKSVAVALAVILIFSFSACRLIYSDDVVSIAEYLKHFDRPEDVVINKLERVEFKNKTIYYMSWSEYQESDEDETELLIVYDHETDEVKNYFMLDMEYGMYHDMKALWDSRETKAISSYTYSAEEIEKLVSEIADYCDMWMDDES